MVDPFLASLSLDPPQLVSHLPSWRSRMRNRSEDRTVSVPWNKHVSRTIKMPEGRGLNAVRPRTP